jgi:hypothetical protein
VADVRQITAMAWICMAVLGAFSGFQVLVFDWTAATASERHVLIPESSK